MRETGKVFASGISLGYFFLCVVDLSVPLVVVLEDAYAYVCVCFICMSRLPSLMLRHEIPLKWCSYKVHSRCGRCRTITHDVPEDPKAKADVAAAPFSRVVQGRRRPAARVFYPRKNRVRKYVYSSST